jgi:hypothetical protein
MYLVELFADEDYRFHMGLRRGSPADFFRPTSAHAALLAERKSWLADKTQTCSAFRPECAELLSECIALATEWKSITDEQQIELGGCRTLETRGQCLGKIWEPDFLLLGAGTAFQLLGGCVCFPSSWNLLEKIGRPLEFIHDPVPGLNTELGRGIDSFMSRLTPGTAWLRHNWGLTRSPELNQHPSRNLPRLDSSIGLNEVWLRVEHQALVALPRTRGILFAIRVAHHSLTEVKQHAAAAERLGRAVRTMPEPVAVYKGIAAARERICVLLNHD